MSLDYPQGHDGPSSPGSGSGTPELDSAEVVLQRLHVLVLQTYPYCVVINANNVITKYHQQLADSLCLALSNIDPSHQSHVGEM